MKKHNTGRVRPFAFEHELRVEVLFENVPDKEAISDFIQRELDTDVKTALMREGKAPAGETRGGGLSATGRYRMLTFTARWRSGSLPDQRLARFTVRQVLSVVMNHVRSGTDVTATLKSTRRRLPRRSPQGKAAPGMPPDSISPSFVFSESARFHAR